MLYDGIGVTMGKTSSSCVDEIQRLSTCSGNLSSSVSIFGLCSRGRLLCVNKEFATPIFRRAAKVRLFAGAMQVIMKRVILESYGNPRSNTGAREVK